MQQIRSRWHNVERICFLNTDASIMRPAFAASGLSFFPIIPAILAPRDLKTGSVLLVRVWIHYLKGILQDPYLVDSKSPCTASDG